MEYMEFPTCPHCGHKGEEAWDLIGVDTKVGEEVEWECDRCEGLVVAKIDTAYWVWVAV